MIGEFFMMNATNVARAAVREAERGICLDAPVEISVGSHDPDGARRLYISVRGQTGQSSHTREIAVDDDKIRACFEAADSKSQTQRLVDELVTEIETAVRGVLQG